jgi:hypothetical protein
MACTCTSTPTKICTPITAGSQTICNCIESKPPIPCAGEIIDLGNNTWICRDTQTVATSECSEVSCDEANGFVYNPVTNKCEKTVTSPPCAGGYVFNPITEECEPPGVDPTPMCPPGSTYNFSTNTCTTSSLSPAIVNTTTACKADIVILVSPCSDPNITLRRKAFYEQLITNLTPGLNSGDIRLQVMVSSVAAPPSVVRLLAGTGTFSGQPGGAAAFFQSLSSTFSSATSSCNVGNSTARGMIAAMAPLYVNDNVVNSGTLVPTRTNVRKILIMLTRFPDDLYGVVPNVTFGSCVSNDISNYLGHYPTSYYYYNAMRYAVNTAVCLKFSTNPGLKIFTATDGDIGSTSLWGGATGENQFYTDIRNAGAAPVYAINNTNAVTLANQLYADILALPGTPAVCSETNSYSCPPGCTLVNTNQCRCETSTPPLVTCDPSCDIVANGTNADCVCSISSVPNQCGDC